jgi:membrane protease YdiL (CAAX protease family)
MSLLATNVTAAQFSPPLPRTDDTQPEDTHPDDPPALDAPSDGHERTPDLPHDNRPTQPEPSSNEPGPAPVPRRIPNLGHALLFASFAGLVLLILGTVLAVMGLSPATVEKGVITLQRPKLQIATMAETYLTVVAAAWLFFPLLWRRRFLDGLQWNWVAARSQVKRLIALGFVLSVMMEIVTQFFAPPKTMPIDKFFLTPSNVWLITVFGTMVAPVFEEICFRGFLVPAFAITYDWLSLPRTDEARTRWQTTTALTPLSFMFSAVLTSILFAAMHGPQYAYHPAALVGLFSISLVLTFVRVKTQSVAASTIVHCAYNSFIFVTLFIATGGYRHLDRMTH